MFFCFSFAEIAAAPTKKPRTVGLRSAGKNSYKAASRAIVFMVKMLQSEIICAAARSIRRASTVLILPSLLIS